MLPTDTKSVNLLFCSTDQQTLWITWANNCLKSIIQIQLQSWIKCSRISLIYLDCLHGPISAASHSFCLQFQWSRSSFAKDWRLSLFSYKYIWVSHIMSTRTVSLTSSSITSWLNWGLNLQRKKDKHVASYTLITETSLQNEARMKPNRLFIINRPVVERVRHFTPGSSSVHCTAIWVRTLDSQRRRDIWRIRNKNFFLTIRIGYLCQMFNLNIK